MTNNGNVQVIDEPDLAPGASKDEEFHSFLVGDKGNIKIASVKLGFDAGNLKSTFEKSAQISTTISDVPISLTFVGPPTSVSGQAVTYFLDYRNQSQDDISDLRFTLTYPDGFRVTKVLPSATIGNTIWGLPLVKKAVALGLRFKAHSLDGKAIQKLLTYYCNAISTARTLIMKRQASRP